MPTTDQISVSTADAGAGNPTTPDKAAPVTMPSRNPDPAPSVSSRKKGIRHSVAFASSSAGIDPLLNCVANVNVSVPQRMETNYFFPDATAFMQAVSACDRAMIATKKFTEATESWTPFTSQYYAALLFHLQVFRTYEKSGIPDQAGFEFLDFFEKRIDLKNVPVPGAWAPYLKALTVCEAHHESYGNIAPVLPTIASQPLNSDNLFSWPPQIMRSIPNPLLPLDQMRALSAHAMGNNNANAFVAYNNVMGLDFAGAADLNNIFQLLLSPTASSWNSMSRSRTATVVEFWRDNAGVLPTRLAHDQDVNDEVNSYFRLFGFENLNGTRNPNLLTVVLNDMATYCQFIKGSVPLSTIDVVGLGAGIPRSMAVSTPQLRDYLYPTIASLRTNRHAQGHRIFPSDVTFNMTHGDLTLDVVGEQYAMTTLINMSFGNVLAQNGLPQIVAADQVDGPFWTIIVMRRALGFSPITSLSTVIPAYYHVTTAVVPKTQ